MNGVLAAKQKWRGSRGDGEGWLEWDKYVCYIFSQRRPEHWRVGTQRWRWKSLEFGAHSCPSRAMHWSHSLNSPSVQLELWLWYSSLPYMHSINDSHAVTVLWALSLTLVNCILLCSWPPYSSSKWQCSSCVIIDVGTLLSLPMWTYSLSHVVDLHHLKQTNRQICQKWCNTCGNMSYVNNMALPPPIFRLCILVSFSNRLCCMERPCGQNYSLLLMSQQRSANNLASDLANDLTTIEILGVSSIFP